MHFTLVSRRLLAVAATLALGIGAGACSSESNSSDGSPTATTTPATAAPATAPAPAPSGASTGASGAAPTGGDRGAIVDFTVQQAAAGGLQLDPDCITGLVGQLNEADADALAASVANPGGGGPQLSAEGQALGERIYDDCIVGSDDQALIDEVIDRVLSESGGTIDEACVRNSVPKFTDEQLHLILETKTGSTGPETTDPALQTAAVFLLDCVNFATSTTG
ncbi:MAG: hypothetical protein ABIR32_14515 [Ilumatobacteraceae bacterium]